MARHGDVVARREVGQQVELLKHEADGASCAGWCGRRRSGCEILPGHAHLAGGRRRESADDVEQRGFARAGRPHDGQELAALDVQIDAAQRRHVDFAHAVDLAQIARLDDGGRYSYARASMASCRAALSPG